MEIIISARHVDTGKLRSTWHVRHPDATNTDLEAAWAAALVTAKKKNPEEWDVSSVVSELRAAGYCVVDIATATVWY